MKKIILGFAMMMLAGCATGWQTAKLTPFKDKEKHFQAIVPTGWMHITDYRMWVATRYGLSLDRIMVKTPKIVNELAHTKKKYSSSMQPLELMELDVDNIKANPNLSKVTILDSQAQVVSGQNAYRIEIEFQENNGYQKRAIQYGFIYKGNMYHIVYEAAKQHYFDQSLSDFQKFMESFVLE